MAIEQVKRDAERADQMIQQLAAGNSAEDIVSTQEAGESVVEEPQAPAEVVEFEQPVQQQHVEQEVVEPAQVSADIERRLAEAEAEAEKANQRWKSLDGMIRSRDKQIEQYQELLSNMTEAQKQTQTEASAPMESVGVQEGDIDTFGEDMIELIQRISREEVRRGVQDIVSTVEGVQTKLEGVSTTAALSAKEVFDAKLTELAPAWATLNENAEFVEWLQASPTRLDMFSQGVNNLDAPAVAEFFNLYSQINNVAEQQQQRVVKTKQEELEAQVAPGKSINTAPVAKVPDEEKIWTRSEIAAIYNDKRHMDSEEFNKLERQINAAMKSNRVDYSQ